ncbi:MAG: hypothetical protein R2699_11660 [Acidimicrobiales bacterium]
MLDTEAVLSAGWRRAAAPNAATARRRRLPMACTATQPSRLDQPVRQIGVAIAERHRCAADVDRRQDAAVGEERSADPQEGVASVGGRRGGPPLVVRNGAGWGGRAPTPAAARRAAGRAYIASVAASQAASCTAVIPSPEPGGVGDDPSSHRSGSSTSAIDAVRPAERPLDEGPVGVPSAARRAPVVVAVGPRPGCAADAEGVEAGRLTTPW